MPLSKLYKVLSLKSGPTAPNHYRFAGVTSAILIVTSSALLGIPWPGAKHISGLVDYEPYTVMRPKVDGFVEQILVKNGQEVQAGDILAILRNDELAQDYAIQELKVEASRLKIRGLRGKRELAALEAETKELAALEKQLTELSSRIDALIPKASVSGRVIIRNASSLNGVFIRQGDELLSIGNESRKQVIFSMPQGDLGDYELVDHAPVTVSVLGNKSFEAKVDHIDPRASLAPFDESLCAPYGGKLLVRQSIPDKRNDEARAKLELLEPHFSGSVLLSADQSERLRTGQRANLVIGAHRESLGAHLWGLISEWLLRSDSPRQS